MKFEIDVSGEDIFHKDYTICIAHVDGNEHIKGFKFNDSLITTLKENWNKGKYRYGISDKQRIPGT